MNRAALSLSLEQQTALKVLAELIDKAIEKVDLLQNTAPSLLHVNGVVNQPKAEKVNEQLESLSDTLIDIDGVKNRVAEIQVRLHLELTNPAPAA